MDKNPNHIISPQGRRTKNRRSEQSKWRSHRQWKALVEAHCHVPEAVCVHCGKKHGQLRKNGSMVVLTINHLSRRLYENEELYCTWNKELMEICCTVCNWMYEKGKEACPICHDKYIGVTEPDHMCQSCYDKSHPLEATVRKELAEIRRIKARKLKRELNRKAREKAKKVHGNDRPGL